MVNISEQINNDDIFRHALDNLQAHILKSSFERRTFYRLVCLLRVLYIANVYKHKNPHANSGLPLEFIIFFKIQATVITCTFSRESQ